MWLRKFWVEVGRLLKVIFRFGDVAVVEKQTSEVNMGVNQTCIGLQSFSVLRNCFVDFAMFFQEGAIAVMRLRGPGRQSNGGFAFGSRLLIMTEVLQKISIAGVILGIVRIDPQRLFKMSLRLVQFSFLR